MIWSIIGLVVGICVVLIWANVGETKITCYHCGKEVDTDTAARLKDLEMMNRGEL